MAGHPKRKTRINSPAANAVASSMRGENNEKIWIPDDSVQVEASVFEYEAPTKKMRRSSSSGTSKGAKLVRQSSAKDPGTAAATAAPTAEAAAATAGRRGDGEGSPLLSLRPALLVIYVL